MKDGKKSLKKRLGQCGRAKIPAILRPNNFKNIIENIGKYDIVLLLYENEHSVTIKKVLEDYKDKVEDPLNIAIVIGPEGGLSEAEVETLSEFDNVKVVTLGNRILRTETAGMTAIAMLSYEFEL